MILYLKVVIFILLNHIALTIFIFSPHYKHPNYHSFLIIINLIQNLTHFIFLINQCQIYFITFWSFPPRILFTSLIFQYLLFVFILFVFPYAINFIIILIAHHLKLIRTLFKVCLLLPLFHWILFASLDFPLFFHLISFQDQLSSFISVQFKSLFLKLMLSIMRLNKC